MSKFHQEFFRQKGSGHDRLILKCVTTGGKKRILGVSGFFGRALSLLEPPEEVWVCDCEKTAWCKRNSGVASVSQPKCAWGYAGCSGKCCNHFNKVPLFVKDLGNPEKYDYEKKEYVPTGKVSELNPVGEWVKVEPLVYVDNLKIGHATEVICKNYNFIAGYADLLFMATVTVRMSLKLSEDWVWKDFRTQEYKERIVIDAKPELKDFGAVLRQIKTYMNLLNVPRGVIATYSDPPAELVELLKNEGVYVAEFSNESKEKKERSIDAYSFI